MPLFFGNSAVASRPRARPVRERLLAISFDAVAISVLDATRTGAGLDGHASQRWTWPQGLSPFTAPDDAGKWLRSQLDSHAIARQPVLLVVPRQTTIQRLLELPDVPAEELPAVVMLQAESRLTRPLEEQCLDFVTTPGRQHALLVSLPRETLLTTQRLLAAAGLVVQAVTIGELNLMTRQRVSDAPGGQLGLCILHDRAELTYSVGGVPIAAGATRLTSVEPNDQRRSIAATVARLLASLPTIYTQSKIHTLALFGAQAEALLLDGESIGCPGAVIVRQSLSGRFDRSSPEWPLLAASLQARDSSHQSLDLLNPRRPVDPSVRIRRQRWLWFAASAALLLGAVGWALSYSNSLDQQIAQLKQRDKDLSLLKERGQPVIEAASSVGEWQTGQVDWPDELGRFVKCLPPHDRAYLTQLTLEIPAAGAPPVIRVNGQAKDTRDVLDFHQRLMSARSGYELRPHGIEPNNRDPDYRATFDVEAVILPRSEPASLSSE